jgi:hypothetical protein
MLNKPREGRSRLEMEARTAAEIADIQVVCDKHEKKQVGKGTLQDVTLLPTGKTVTCSAS